MCGSGLVDPHVSCQQNKKIFSDSDRVSNQNKKTEPSGSCKTPTSKVKEEERGCMFVSVAERMSDHPSSTAVSHTLFQTAAYPDYS